jgi:hypothetical protein
MKRYAIIKGEEVINVVSYENPPSNPPLGFPADHIAVESERASPGWLYKNGQLIDTIPIIPHVIEK